MMEMAVFTKTRSSSWLSFDLARIAAISLVVWYHLLSVSDIDPPQIFGLLNIGQLGVAIFCGLSGYFSLRSIRTGNRPWITHRLKRIFMPYWLSLIPIFVANAVTHYKPMSVSLILSEFLGLAGFTHRQSLVGVHVWFISLILACYGIAVVIRWRQSSLPLIAVLVFLAFRWDPIFLAHIVSFLSGCVLSIFHRSSRRSWIGIAVILLCVAGTVILHKDFAYPVAATLMVLICMAFS
jgi:hypothetical protein